MSLGEFIGAYSGSVVCIMGTWIMVCWVEDKQNNVIIMSACSLLWPAAILYFTFRYAVPWLSARIYRDALLLIHKQNAIKEVESLPRSPAETGIYD